MSGVKSRGGGVVYRGVGEVFVSDVLVVLDDFPMEEWGGE